jgi:hypothetical protein
MECAKLIVRGNVIFRFLCDEKIFPLLVLSCFRDASNRQKIAYSGFRLNRPQMLAGERSRTVGAESIPRLRNRVSRFIPGRPPKKAYKKPGF